MIKQAPRVSSVSMYVVDEMGKYLYNRHLLDSIRVDLGIYSEIKEELEKEKVILGEKYGIREDKIIDYFYREDYVTSEYIFCNYFVEIKGKVSVGFWFSKDDKGNFIKDREGRFTDIYIVHMFRSWIEFEGTNDEYKKHCKDLMNLSKKLNLILSTITYGSPRAIDAILDPFLQPIFFVENKIEKKDVFNDFMKKVNTISEIYPLSCPVNLDSSIYF